MISKAPAPAAGLRAFTLSSAASHHSDLRPYIGVTGMIVSEEHGGSILRVMFKGAPGVVTVARGLGTVSRRQRIDLGNRVVETPSEYIGPARRYSVELPLPPRDLSPNIKPMPWTKAQAVARFRTDCQRLIIDAGIPPLRIPVLLGLDFYLHRLTVPVARWGSIYDPMDWYYPTDKDNARSACKPLQDSLVLAGVIDDDDHKHVDLGETNLHLTPAEHGGRTCLVLTIEEMLAAK